MTDNLPTVSEIAAQGGKARAKALTPARRREIAQQAVSARWHRDVPIAEYEGDLDFVGTKVPCAVLSDGTRLLSERGLTKGFGMKRAGSNWQRKMETGARLPVFASARNLKAFMDQDLRLALCTPILYRPKNNPGAVAYGTRADLIPKICDVWLKARDAGALLAQQAKIAIQADLISRGLAHVGIIAMVDEATGYQDERARNALAKILEQFVTEELRKWVKTFPLPYFRELCRLRSVPFSETMQLPQYFGHLTNDIIYSRLAPGVLTELKRVVPIENGRRKKKLHQALTEDVGHPKLLQHLGSVVTLMKISPIYEEFHEMLDKVHPTYRDMPLFAGLDDD